MRKIKKGQIIQESIRLFAQYGYKKTTLDDIANVMGMTRGNLYHYVENKEDLYFQAIKTTLDDWKEVILAQTQQQSNSMERVHALLITSIEYPKEHPYFCSLILDDPCLISNTYFEHKKFSFQEVAEEVLKEFLYDGIYRGMLRDVDVDHTVQFILSIHMMYLLKIYSKEYDENAMNEYLNAINLMCHGLKIE